MLSLTSQDAKREPTKAEREVIAKMTYDQCWDHLEMMCLSEQAVFDLLTKYTDNNAPGGTRRFYENFARLGLGAVSAGRDGPYLLTNMTGSLVIQMTMHVNQHGSGAEPEDRTPGDGNHRDVNW